VPREIVLVRHGETEWAREERHTGRTDVPLTGEGRREAEVLGRRLAGYTFALVLTSPLRRAVDTCRLAGLGAAADVRQDLAEWDYGRYEGRTTPEIRAEAPGWSLWRDGCPGGETAADVGRRADRLIAELRPLAGDAAVFAHGHLLRVLAARWVGMPAEAGGALGLSTATISILGHEHDLSVIWLWNDEGRFVLPEL
jgi:broad specificity phosphatase PhoE